MSAVFNAVSTMVWNGADVVTPEMYDTSVRASASGFLTGEVREKAPESLAIRNMSWLVPVLIRELRCRCA